jgi:hypothetical protein
LSGVGSSTTQSVGGLNCGTLVEQGRGLDPFLVECGKIFNTFRSNGVGSLIQDKEKTNILKNKN